MGLLCAPLLSRGPGGQGSAGKGFVMSQACSGWAVLLFSLPSQDSFLLIIASAPPSHRILWFVIIRKRGAFRLKCEGFVDTCLK